MLKKYLKNLNIKPRWLSWLVCLKWYIIAYRCVRNKRIETCELDPAHFLSAPGLAWQACLKKNEVELELLTNIDILLMADKGIQGAIWHAIHRYAKANNNIWRIIIKHWAQLRWIIIPHLFRCKQFAWVGNVLKIACKQF